MRILIALGTRPEIIKLAPVVRRLRTGQHEVVLVATGQHYDPELTEVFYQELGVRPDMTLGPSDPGGQRFGAMMDNARTAVDQISPELVLLLGDTNTVPAFCLAARAANRPVAHVEAGLRSFNPTSIEEVNRRVAAATAALHFAPTVQAGRFLTAEGVPKERIFVVGNPVCDTLRELHLDRVPPQKRTGVLLTAHRASNVDNPARLAELVRLVEMLADRLAPVTFPVHPRTQSRLKEAGALAVLHRSGVRLSPPLPYRQLLEVLASSRVVVTDSGGLQEEASWLGVPAVVLRRSTPRWEGVAAGTSTLTGMDAETAFSAAEASATSHAQDHAFAADCPYGDGHTAQRIRSVLDDPATLELLRLEEPDFVGKPPPS